MGAPQHYKVAIVGSGPGGLSAAGRAAQLGLEHVLLESTETWANTIQRFQKGKFVMAEPSYLPLRSDCDFDIGKREQILKGWGDGIDTLGVNVRYKAEVTGISGSKGGFSINLADGSQVGADFVILAIGVQGNPRRMGVPGSEVDFVQYTLDDPDEYQDENILVIGAGDAAIENAMGLAANNHVTIVNRGADFARAKDGNNAAIMKMIDSGQMSASYNSNSNRVELTPDAEHKAVLVVETPDGEVPLPCDRIIARLGAIPPRKFVESCGIEFPNQDRTALPVLTTQYESNVPGLYIIGALGGYPLIKQAMNQGYEAVEYLCGNDIQPVDHDLMVNVLSDFPYELDVNPCLDLLRQRIPMFTQINALLFREFMLESKVLQKKKGDTVYAQGDYTNTFYTVVEGDVRISLDDEGRGYDVRDGEFFGELSLISGSRRSNTAVAIEDAILIETPRRIMNKLIASIDSVREGIDEIYIARILQEVFAPSVPVNDLREIAAESSFHQYSPGEIIFNEGDTGQVVHVIRKGAVLVSRKVDGQPITIDFAHSGQYVGEMSIVGTGEFTETVMATVITETLSIDQNAFRKLLTKENGLVQRIQDALEVRLNGYADMISRPDKGEALNFLIDHGMGEATDAFLIDESLCVGCDNCEAACADTHLGISRLDRRKGPTFNGVHIPTVCRHCEIPHCMKDCPPDAIHRTETGEVFIDRDVCIGCGNCKTNCPYGVITMAHAEDKRESLLMKLLFGRKSDKASSGGDQIKKALKCDLCKDDPAGPACIRACPTGAAIRIPPESFVDVVH